MKTSKDPRHIQRIKTMQEIFSWQFLKAGERNSGLADQEKEGVRKLSAIAQDLVDNKDKIDEFIQQAAPEWPIEKINKIDLAVLRLGVYELFFVKKAPTKVIVDEAVELAKEYGSEASGKFVNGVLGTLIDQHPTKLH